MAQKLLTPEESQIKSLKKQYRKEKFEKIGAVALAIIVAVTALAIGKGTKKDTANGTNTPSTQNGNGLIDPSADVDLTPDETLSDDPSQWTTEQIITYYKQSAAKSHATAKSSQTMTLTKMVVNDGDGALGFFINMLTPVIESVVADQTLSFDGITGGYNNLVASDAASAKAYKEGNYIIIEMSMVEQTDGLYGDPLGGTVGHAISVVGDVSTAVAEFPQFDVKYKEADIKVHYANPTVKVRINPDGIIEKGTWQYTAQIDIKHLQIESVMVDKADAEIIYKIVVGDGF